MKRKAIALSLFLLSIFLLVMRTEAASLNASRTNALYRLLREVNIGETIDFSCLDRFSDNGMLEESEKRLFAFAVEHNIITGFEDGTLRPDAELSRAEFACMIYRCAPFAPLRERYVTFASDYPDIADWNRTEIAYCMEYGFLMGNGDSFGSADPLTREQIETVTNRMKYGLSSREKYTLLSLNHCSPINLEQMEATKTDPKLTPSMNDFARENLIYEYNPEILSLKFRDIVEQQGTFRYAAYLADPDGEFARLSLRYRYLTESISTWNESELANPSVRPYRFLREHIASQATRDSIFVVSPEHCYSYEGGSDYEGTHVRNYEVHIGSGYEYFIYHDALAENLPDGIEIGQWYRRIATVQWWIEFGRAPDYMITVEYGEAEPVPAQILN